MKIQELAIIFIIIILPISLVLAEYTQFQIKTMNTQSVYDAKLTSATYDAIKAFQLNAQNETYSDIANLRVENIEASVNAFRNSIMSTFKLNGYTEEQLDNYIPALVYTLYDGFYIYSPYNNTNHRYEDPTSTTGESMTVIEPTAADIAADGNGENLYGLKPYINYSCRYVTPGIDVVITYALDNYITVQGTINGAYYNKSGYLIDNIIVSGEVDIDGDGTIDEYNITYNGVDIEEEQLYENVGGTSYPYFKNNGIKYYLVGNNIVTISNGELKVQFSEERDPTMFNKWKTIIENNNFAKQYYKEADKFTEWFKTSGLNSLTYADAVDEVIDDLGDTQLTNIWDGDTRVIFDFNTSANINNNIENELSSFNQHRLAIIRHKIETNLAIAIANYNSYSGAANVFQMPELKEDEWDQITHNISLISFLQGLPIGGKIYNGYTLVTNSESKEVVLENNIYILGDDGNYHRIGDNTLNIDDRIVVNSSGTHIEDKRSAGRLNLDFKRTTIINNNNIETYYYYPLKDYNASYNSIVMQNDVTTYDDIYAYVATQGYDLQKAFYTALGRERSGKYNTNIIIDTGDMEASSSSGGTSSSLSVYTITYDANGGFNEPVQQQKNHGESITLSSQIPQRDGWIFRGWSRNQYATTAQYIEGSTYANDANVTLYAVWGTDTVITYTITYDGNGGTGGPGTREVTYGLSVLAEEEPTRDGYTFKGWRAVDGTIYQPRDTLIVIEDITLYAVWEEIPVVSMYTVTYNANGGEFNSGNTTMQEIIESGGNITSEIPRKTGYRFLGWSEDSSATTATYLTEGTYAGNSDITLYAIWEVEQYTITYDANGGTFSSGSTTMLGTVAYGARLTSAQPSRTGYTFLGWATSSSATSAEYESGATYTKDESVTLYAVWKIKTYTVAYHANGGTISKGPDTKTHGVDLTLTTVQPVRTGYTFLGWATSSSATSVEYAPGGTYTKDESVTLYAVWKVSGLAGTYSVTFNGNGGTVGTTFSNLSTVYTTTIKTGGSIPNLICIGKIGYTFKGWATSASSNTIAYKAGDTFTGTSNTTLYAIWVKNGTEIM